MAEDRFGFTRPGGVPPPIFGGGISPETKEALRATTEEKIKADAAISRAREDRGPTTIVGGGRPSGRPTTPEEEALIEETRQAGLKRIEQKRLAAERSAKLEASLRAREDIRRIATERGKGFSRLQIQRELKKRGTSIPELRTATRASIEQFKRTGVRFEEELKKEREVSLTIPKEEKEVSITPQQLSTLESLNQRVAEVTTKPVFQFFQDISGVDLTDPSTANQSKIAIIIERLKGREDVIGSIARFLEPFSPEEKAELFGQTGPVAEFERRSGIGAFTGVKEEPVTTAITFATGFGFSKLGIPLLTQVSKLPGGGIVTGAVSKGLPLIFFGSKGFEIAVAEGAGAKGEVLGRTLTTEVLPFIAGVKLGKINFRIVDKLQRLNSVFENSRVSLAESKRARVGRGKVKQKQVQVKKAKKKASIDKKSLQDALEKASSKDVKAWRDRQLKIIDQSTKTEFTKQQERLIVDALILEAKSGVPVITESGKIDIGQANEAVIALQAKFITKASPTKIKTLIIPTSVSATRVEVNQAKNQARIEQAQKPLGQRLAETQAGQVGRAFGAPSEFAGTGQFEKTEAVGNRLLQETKTITDQLRQTGLSRFQLTNLRQNMDVLQRQLLINKSNQALQNNQRVNQLNRQLQQNKQRQDSLTRQLSLTKSAQRTDQLTRQLQQTRVAQDSLTRQLSVTQTLQKSLTKQVNRLKIKQRVRRIVRKPKIPKPFIFPKEKKKAVRRLKFIPPKPKKFQVFVKKKGKDVFFKSFKTKRKARVQLKKQLANTLRASGFIFDKNRGVKVKPKVTKGFRLGKKDPFRLVEIRNLRLDSRKEVKQIQKAKKTSNPIKLKKNNLVKKIKMNKPVKAFKNKSNFKSSNLIKLKRRKK